MTEKEIDELAVALKAYFNAKNNFEPKKIHSKEEQHIRLRKDIVSPLKEFIKRQEEEYSSPYLASSFFHSNINELKEFIADIERVFNKREMDIRTKTLIKSFKIPQKTTKSKEFYSIKEVAEILDCSDKTVENYIKSGALVSKKFKGEGSKKTSHFIPYTSIYDCIIGRLEE